MATASGAAGGEIAAAAAAAPRQSRLVWGGDGRVRAYPLHETTPAEATDASAVRARLCRDGYLFCRGLLPRGDVLAARSTILGFASSRLGETATAAAVTAAAAEDGSAADRPMTLLGRQDIAAMPTVKKVLESQRVAQLLQRSAGAPAGTDFFPVPYKWLRSVGPGLFTGVHMDRVYFPDIDPLTHTCWLPLGDVPVSHGSMMICEGAHAHGDGRFTELRERYLGGPLTLN